MYRNIRKNFIYKESDKYLWMNKYDSKNTDKLWNFIIL